MVWSDWAPVRGQRQWSRGVFVVQYMHFTKVIVWLVQQCVSFLLVLIFKSALTVSLKSGHQPTNQSKSQGVMVILNVLLTDPSLRLPLLALIYHKDCTDISRLRMSAIDHTGPRPVTGSSGRADGIEKWPDSVFTCCSVVSSYSHTLLLWFFFQFDIIH